MGIGTFIRFCFDRPKAFWFGLVATGFSLLFAALMGGMLTLAEIFPDQPDYEELSAQGRKGTARIVEVDTVMSVAINDKNPMRIVYSFADAQGARVKDTVETMENPLPAVGSDVPVRYLGTDSVLEGFPPYYFPTFIFILMPGIFAVIGLPFLAFSLAGASRKFRLYRTGELTGGKLLSMVPIYTGFLPFISTRFAVAYSYSPDGAEPRQTHSIISDLAFINEHRTGDTIDILFDRRDPRNSCVKEKLDLGN